MIGSSGSGKTYIIKQIAKYLNRPLVIIDSSSLTKSGFVGKTYPGYLQDYTEKLAQRYFENWTRYVYLRWKHKMLLWSSKNAGAQGKGYRGRDVQYELLKLVEGGKVPIKTGGMLGQGTTIEIDTTNILFICGGAFTVSKNKNCSTS